MTGQPKRRRGRPLAGDRVVWREQILEQALRAFATHGYEAMSVRALSMELGGSPDLVRHCYSSKQALWEASVDRVLNQVRQALKLLSQLSKPDSISPDIARDVLEATIRIAVENPDLVQIALDEGRVGGPRLDHLFDDGFGPVHEVLTQTIGKLGGDAAAVSQDEQQSLFFVGLVGAAAPFFAGALSKRFGGADPSSEDAKERHIRVVADMISDRWQRTTRTD